MSERFETDPQDVGPTGISAAPGVTDHSSTFPGKVRPVPTGDDEVVSMAERLGSSKPDLP